MLVLAVYVRDRIGLLELSPTHGYSEVSPIIFNGKCKVSALPGTLPGFRLPGKYG